MNELPLTFEELLLVCMDLTIRYDLRQKERSDILEIFREFVLQLVSQCYTQEHPIAQFCRLVWDLNDGDFYDTIVQCLKFIVDTIQINVTQSHPWLLWRSWTIYVD